MRSSAGLARGSDRGHYCGSARLAATSARTCDPRTLTGEDGSQHPCLLRTKPAVQDHGSLRRAFLGTMFESWKPYPSVYSRGEHMLYFSPLLSPNQTVAENACSRMPSGAVRPECKETEQKKRHAVTRIGDSPRPSPLFPFSVHVHV